MIATSSLFLFLLHNKQLLRVQKHDLCHRISSLQLQWFYLIMLFPDKV